MSNEISSMIELQHHWTQVISKEAEITRCNKSLNIWEEHLEKEKALAAGKDTQCRSMQKKLREKEGILSEIESKIDKAEKRKDLLKSSREIEAHESEIQRLRKEKSIIELEVLDMMELLEKNELELAEINSRLEVTKTQTEKDRVLLMDKISKLAEEIKLEKDKFHEKSELLDPRFKSRFMKLVSSKDGIAIAKLNGEICSHCNFQIPSSLANSVSKGEVVETCTNCGRFIYI